MEDFFKTIRSAFPAHGGRWIEALPSLMKAAAEQWDLTDIETVKALSYNYVAYARQGEKAVVLKIGVPDREFISEISALEQFDGRGSVRLLHKDEARYMFLMERLVPGTMLVSRTDDEQNTHIACDVMQALWRPPSGDTRFIRLSDWFTRLESVRPDHGGSTGRFPKALFERAETLIPDLFAHSSPQKLIHGDLHHYNILRSGEGWTAIDPKGVIGPPEYECGPYLLNPWGELNKNPDVKHLLERRIAILSERLGFSRERVRDWGFCHAILSAHWDMTENEPGRNYPLEIAEILAAL